VSGTLLRVMTDRIQARSHQ